MSEYLKNISKSNNYNWIVLFVVKEEKIVKKFKLPNLYLFLGLYEPFFDYSFIVMEHLPEYS